MPSLQTLALAALLAWSAVIANEPIEVTYNQEPPAQCETDTDCEAMCRESLRPDEDESICDAEA